MSQKLNDHIELLVLTQAFPPDYSGAAQQMLTLGRSLRRQGHRMNVITFVGSRSQPGRATEEGITVVRLKNPSGRMHLSKMLNVVILRKTFRDLAKLANAILLITGLSNQVILSLLGVRGLRYFYRTSLLGFDDYESLRRAFGARRIDCFLSRASGIVTNSPAILTSFETKFSEKTALIPNAVDSDVLKSMASAHSREETIARNNLEASRLHAIAVGAVCKRKGVDEMVRTFARVKNLCSSAGKLLVVGPNTSSESGEVDDEYVDGIRRFIAEAGIGQDVRLCGHLDQKELVELLGVCELFISFSQSEGFPNALVEAMAAGCVPVVRRIPDVTDWILPAELRGLTGDITTVDELSAAWIKMLENKSKRLELKNVVRKKVREDFEAAVIAGRYADFFLSRISQ